MLLTNRIRMRIPRTKRKQNNFRSTPGVIAAPTLTGIHYIYIGEYYEQDIKENLCPYPLHHYVSRYPYVLRLCAVQKSKEERFCNGG